MKCRKVIAALLLIILMTGVCGCMRNEDHAQLKQELLTWAQEKYAAEFEVCGIIEAADRTRSDILTLKDADGLHFNVYHYAEDGSVYDDYCEAVVDEKCRQVLLKHPLFAQDGAELGVRADVIFDYDIEMLKSMSWEECVSRYGLDTLIVVIRLKGGSGTIAGYADWITDLCSLLNGQNAGHLRLNVIACDSEEASLDAMLTNMRLEYSRNWYLFDSVCEYISVLDPNFGSSADLIEQIKGE